MNQTKENKIETTKYLNGLMGFLKYDLVKIGLAFVFVFIVYKFQENRDEKEKKILSNDGIIIKSTVENVFKSSRNTRISYSYYYQGKKYKDSAGCETCPYRIIKCLENRECIGDTILIKVSKSNPEKTMIIKYSTKLH
jgi:hypothetical protein